jgi:quinol monooxygenase YgiN
MRDRGLPRSPELRFFGRCANAQKESAMIHVVAIITAKPGSREEVLAHFRANMPAVRAEPGCIEYGPAIDAEGGPGAKYGTDTFVVIEKWESLDALRAHAASPHMQAYSAKTRELLAGREIHVLAPAA